MFKIVGMVVVFFQNPRFVHLCAKTSLLSRSSYYVKVLSKIIVKQLDIGGNASFIFFFLMLMLHFMKYIFFGLIIVTDMIIFLFLMLVLLLMMFFFLV